MPLCYNGFWNIIIFIIYIYGGKTMMQNYVDVTIGGKNYRLAASENRSSEFMLHLAEYIDSKYSAIIEEGGPSIIRKEAFPILFALNIAEDLLAEISRLSSGDTALREAELQQEVDKLRSTIDFYSKQDNENKGRWDDLMNKQHAAEAENKALRESLDTAETELSQLKEANASLEQALSAKTAAYETVSKKNSDKNQELNQLSIKLSEKNRILNELNTKSAERNQKLNAVNKERDELAIKLKEQKTKAAELEKQLDELQAKMQIGSKGYNSLQKDKAELDLEISDLTAENARLKEACDALTRENAKLSEDYNKLKAKRTGTK